MFQTFLRTMLVLAVSVTPKLSAADAPTPAEQQQIDEILVRWQDQMDRLRTVQVEFDRYEYRRSVALEVRSKGEYFFDASGRSRVDVRPVDLTEAVKGPDRGANGRSMRLASCNVETLIHDGCRLLSLTEWGVAKHSSRIEIPQQFNSEVFTAGLIRLPLLFGSSSEWIKENFRLELGTLHEWDLEDFSGKIHVVANRKPDKRSTCYDRVEVLLDGRTYLPTAVRLSSVTKRNSDECVYVVKWSSYRVNRAWKNRVSDSTAGEGFDPFRPTLQGYRSLSDYGGDASSRMIPDSEFNLGDIEDALPVAVGAAAALGMFVACESAGRALMESAKKLAKEASDLWHASDASGGRRAVRTF